MNVPAIDMLSTLSHDEWGVVLEMLSWYSELGKMKSLSSTLKALTNATYWGCLKLLEHSSNVKSLEHYKIASGLHILRGRGTPAVRCRGGIHSLSTVLNLGEPVSCNQVLRQVELPMAAFESLQPFSSCRMLEALVLSSVRLVSYDLTPLQDCLSLQVLVLDHTRINDVSALISLCNLRFLNISYTDVVGECSLPASIEELNIDGTEIASVPFASLSCLKLVMMSFTCVSSIAGIGGCSQLQSIRLSQNNISDVSPLRFCKKLCSVDLRHTHVTDVSSLETLKNITFFSCSWNNVVGMTNYAPQQMDRFRRVV